MTTIEKTQDDLNSLERVFVNCDRCGGQGLLRGYEHIEGGICFECWGDRGYWSTVGAEARKERRREQARQRRKDKAAKKLEAEDKRQETWIAEHPELAVIFDGGNEFYDSLAEGVRKYGELTDRQLEALVKGIERAAQREAEKAEATPVPVTEDRQAVSGKVISRKWQESRFGASLKMIVLDERGFRVWGTVPSSLTALDNNDGIAIGDTVTFTAKLEVSGDDPTFGFFKRPTKAAIVARAEREEPYND